MQKEQKRMPQQQKQMQDEQNRMQKKGTMRGHACKGWTFHFFHFWFGKSIPSKLNKLFESSLTIEYIEGTKKGMFDRPKLDEIQWILQPTTCPENTMFFFHFFLSKLLQ